jgi:hypothetical protein
MPLSFRYAFLLMAAGALLVSGRWRRVALQGLVPLGLGIAAIDVRLGTRLSDLALAAAERSAPLLFLRLNTGLLLLGSMLVCLGVGAALIQFPRHLLSWVAALLVAAGVAPLIGAIGPLLSYIEWLPTIGAAVAIGLAAAALYLLLRRLRLSDLVRWADSNFLERNDPGLIPIASTSFDLVWMTGLLASAIVLAITPSLRAFCLATAVLGVVSHVLLRRLGGGSPVPVSALFALLIVPVYQFLVTVAGDPTVTLRELGSAPFSTAAEIRVLPWLALAAFGFAGLWPLHGLVLPLAAPIAGILLIRIGAHALPNGMEHWAPLFIPLAVLGIWHGAVPSSHPQSVLRRWMEMLTGMAIIGTFAGGDGVTGAYWLLAAVTVIPLTVLGVPVERKGGGLTSLFWLPVAWGLLLVTAGGLASQVTYTVLAALGIAAAIQVYAARE